MILEIQNDGPLIVSTNFWESEAERLGLFFLSTNARALRLLVPRGHESTLAEMATAKIVVALRPRNPSRYALRLQFDDATQKPFFVDLSEGQLDRIPPPEESGRRDLEFTAWTEPRRGVPHEALRRPAAYLTVARLD